MSRSFQNFDIVTVFTGGLILSLLSPIFAVPSPCRADEGATNPGNNLHVSGLALKVEQRDLEEFFSTAGKVIIPVHLYLNIPTFKDTQNLIDFPFFLSALHRSTRPLSCTTLTPGSLEASVS